MDVQDLHVTFGEEGNTASQTADHVEPEPLYAEVRPKGQQQQPIAGAIAYSEPVERESNYATRAYSRPPEEVVPPRPEGHMHYTTGYGAWSGKVMHRARPPGQARRVFTTGDHVFLNKPTGFTLPIGHSLPRSMCSMPNGNYSLPRSAAPDIGRHSLSKSVGPSPQMGTMPRMVTITRNYSVPRSGINGHATLPPMHHPMYLPQTAPQPMFIPPPKPMGSKPHVMGLSYGDTTCLCVVLIVLAVLIVAGIIASVVLVELR